MSVQAAGQPDVAGALRHLQPDQPREFQQSSQHYRKRDERQPVRRGDVPDRALDSQRRSDADGAVQPHVPLLTLHYAHATCACGHRRSHCRGGGIGSSPSTRGPASHQALVGLRSTMGLVSRAGVVPLNLAADIAGVVTRTVADTAAVLQVIAGSDPDDPVTVVARPFQGRDGGGPERPASQPKYADSLRRDGLKGARLGVLHQAYDTPMLDAEIKELFSGAIGEFRDLGAEVIDPAAVAGFDDMRRAQTGGCNQFKHDLNQYLGALGGKAPSRSLDEIIKSRQFHPSIQGAP
ncbi:MAG: hypothetical protein DMG04_29485 [Acidobacteria bacterium]|nr:MAG: hypothetical protein DMG04_29485 [Acidobacteriota bacterium]